MGIAIKRLNAFFIQAQAVEATATTRGRKPSPAGLRKILNDLEHKIKTNKMMVNGMKDKLKRATKDTPPKTIDAAKAQIKLWQDEIAHAEEQLVKRKAQARELGVKRRIV